MSERLIAIEELFGFNLYATSTCHVLSVESVARFILKGQFVRSQKMKASAAEIFLLLGVGIYSQKH